MPAFAAVAVDVAAASVLSSRASRTAFWHSVLYLDTFLCVGETPLHLASRSRRVDAAKHLLEAGADPNVKDSTGRTPLHSAISADAFGVFSILLRNRATDIDGK